MRIILIRLTGTCSPFTGRDTMYICLCNAITDRQIMQAAELGARSPQDLAQHLGVGLGCGRCVSCAEAVLNEHVAAVPCPAEKLAA